MTLLYKTQSKDILNIAKLYLTQGKIVCLPSETVYAMSCLSNCNLSINKIYNIKKRDNKKSLALFCSDIVQIDKIAFLNKIAIQLIEKFTPGPITLVLKSKIKDTIAVRIPNNNFTLQLLKEIDIPLIATSVNSSGFTSATDIYEIETSIFEQFDLIIDGGKSDLSFESTIIDLTEDKIKVIREGALDINKIIKID